ncbi:MAG: universal stress protein [Kineosporiaceae bacterium]|nr:universal stress protein [Kineosporiaceae bacterium]
MTVVIAFVPKPAGWAALSAGIEEAQRRGEPVHVVNVSRGDQLVDPGYASPEELQELRSRLELSGLGFTLDHHVGEDTAAEAVVEAAHTVDASVIVIGIRHRSATGKFLFGSDAQRILLAAPCPVLAVKAAGDD